MLKKIVVTGSLAYDHIMSMPGRFKDQIMPDKLHILNVSFIMNTFRQEYGGTGGNIAYTLGLLNTPCLLAATVGGDFGLYRKHLAKMKNIDLKGVKVFKKSKTARGFVTTDRDDNQIWGFYDGAMRNASKISLKLYIDRESLLVIAPNDPKAMMRYVREAINLKVPYVFDPAFNITHFTHSDLKKAVKYSNILIGNDYEITLVKRRLNLSSKSILKNCHLLVTTLGSEGSRIESEHKVIHVPVAKPENQSDPTGAGDAFRAGFMAGYVRDLPLRTCGKMGALTAVYTVEKYGTQTHKFTLSQFYQRYKENFNNELPELKRLDR
ncbi:MAG: hypothetical protein A2Z69_00885 [Bacteroidetes bacterium RBG_13_44_24]|nr:MAG: hypothetical protein A2Z69_00885 [Bacteroidetes bacterium RBG_13_44_24]